MWFYTYSYCFSICIYIYILFIYIHTGHGTNMENSPEKNKHVFFNEKGWLICETCFGTM